MHAQIRSSRARQENMTPECRAKRQSVTLLYRESEYEGISRETLPKKTWEYHRYPGKDRWKAWMSLLLYDRTETRDRDRRMTRTLRDGQKYWEQYDHSRNRERSYALLSIMYTHWLGRRSSWDRYNLLRKNTIPTNGSSMSVEVWELKIYNKIRDFPASDERWTGRCDLWWRYDSRKWGYRVISFCKTHWYHYTHFYVFEHCLHRNLHVLCLLFVLRGLIHESYYVRWSGGDSYIL